ncbi:MAG: TIGR01244 family sulfur transferase, partial [OM182 bacterium]|nr:TIGR01244 family sulfur transferase [OM182 bacterium]
MRIMTLNTTLTVSAQVEIEELAELKANGVTSLVCNRPDGESQDQVAFETLSAAAEALGITVVNLPFKSGEQTDAQVQKFADLLDEAQAKSEKVHAYCRTGNRSTCLWSAAAVSRGASAQEVLATAKEVGFDVSDAVKPYVKDNELT